MPFLTLRKNVRSAAESNPKCEQSAEVWSDVSYLLKDNQNEEHEGTYEHVIREDHVSIVLCGMDEFKWTGWGFVNTTSDPTIEDSKDDDEGEEDQNEAGDDYEGVNEDYFATDGVDELAVYDEDALWDPRRYWLRTIDVRVQSILKEWEWLVKNVEHGVETWVSLTLDISAHLTHSPQKEKHAGTLTEYPGTGIQHDTQQLAEITMLLRKLRAKFKITLQAWARFTAPDGDIRFFSDLHDAGTLKALKSLKSSFQEMSSLRQKLLLLDESCKESDRIVSSAKCNNTKV